MQPCWSQFEIFTKFWWGKRAVVSLYRNPLKNYPMVKLGIWSIGCEQNYLNRAQGPDWPSVVLCLCDAPNVVSSKVIFFALTLCLPIDGVARIFLFFLHSKNTRSRHLLCLVPSFTYLFRREREKNHMNIATRQCRRRESNQGRQHSKGKRNPLHHFLPAA